MRRGYAVEIDTDGYDLPTSIAFVPRPGVGAKDPLYFVTEVRGTIKVVTNDRSVFTFAKDFFTLRPISAWSMPNSPEVGLTGICLEPERGYVYVTFAYQDAGGILRNNIVRFQSTPGRFSLTPRSFVDFRDIFRNDQSAVSHQIGPCQVHGDHLFVSVGDGAQPNRSRRRDSTLGKVLRMTLDGKPARDNPFFTASAPDAPAAYIWALGLRNPFGLQVVGGRPYVVDNGNNIERFTGADRGEDYLWSGSDAGIGAKAIAVISSANGVSGLAYTAGSPRGFPEGFFFNFSGSPVSLNEQAPPRVVHLGYSVADQKLLSVPEPFLRYRGRRTQVLASLAFGPDGLYVVPLLPNEQGVSPIVKMVPAPAARYPFVLEEELNPQILFEEKGCAHCHYTRERETAHIGPNLETQRLVPRVRERLRSDSYRQAVARVDELDEEPYRSFRAARKEVLAASGVDQVRLWLKYRILEPRFDNTTSAMPNLGLTEDEAGVLAELLAGSAPPRATIRAGIRQALAKFLPTPFMLRHLGLFFVIGFIAGAGSMIAFRLVRRRRVRGLAPGKGGAGGRT